MDEIIQQVKKTKLEEGDLIVFKYPGMLSEDAVCRIKEEWHRAIVRMGLEGKVQVVVLEEGIDMEVLKKGEYNEQKIQDTFS